MGVCVLAMGVRLSSAEARIPGADMKAADAERILSLQHRAFAATEALPGMGAVESVDVQIQAGETFEQAVRRLGVSPEDAEQAVTLLTEAFDTVRIRAGLRFKAAVARPEVEGGEARLMGLSFRTGPATQITLSRSFDGSLRLREMTEELREETTIIQGEIDRSLYKNALDLGAPAPITNQAIKLFAHKFDMSRDLRDGDEFRLVFTRTVTESGRTVSGKELLYAEITAKNNGDKPVRFYRFNGPDGKADYFDEEGKSTRGFLMQTPMGFGRVTSGFGGRIHPVLGYRKDHTGIDFAGSTGTPIYASGDGTVVMAGRHGGYGNWVQIRHGQGWETGYAHLSRFGPGIRNGTRVRQGQLIGYVGATGRVTGPHLHYEVIHNGRKVNPRSAQVPAGGSELSGGELTAFRTRAAELNATIAANEDAESQVRLASETAQPRQARVIVAPPRPIALRPTAPSV